VRAVDNAGNVGAAVTRDFTVDTTAPAASIDGVSVTGAAASVRLSSPDTDVARFECRLDDGDYAACASPKQFAGLGDGQHTVAVRAVDNAGNVGAAVTRDFTVDTTAPAASIDGVNVTGAAASVRFSSPDTDVARFECRLDDSDYAACTSPKQFAGLGDGQHTLAVRAVDGTGNVGAPVARDFTVDTTAPAAGIDKLDVARDTATVRFSSPDTDVARFECSLDHGDYAACASPKQFAGLGDGQHTVAVRAVDRTGNVGAASSVTFTIDTTAPASTVDGVNVTGATATVTFFSHDPDVARFECKVDDGEYASCTSPQQFRGLSDGRHTVAVRAVDGAGNTGVAQARDFAVDTTGPVVAIDGVQVAGTTATARFSSRDAGVVRFDCRLDGAAYAACTSPKRYAGLAVGTHTLAVRAVDATGNVGPAVARAFSVQAPPAGGGTPAPVADRTPPTVGLTPGTARVSRTGVVKLRVACSAGEVSCAVTVHLERGGRRIARGSTTVAGGRSRAISLRLRWAARRTLARRHRMKATATISARDAAGNSKTTTKTITLIAPRHVR
jgi:predicted phage tail protein